MLVLPITYQSNVQSAKESNMCFSPQENSLRMPPLTMHWSLAKAVLADPDARPVQRQQDGIVRPHQSSCCRGLLLSTISLLENAGTKFSY